MAQQLVSSVERVGNRSAVFPATLAALLLGFFVVLVAGFAGSAAVHNAAHDARHISGFPCH